MQAIIGDYGFGKSHFVELAARRALRENFVVATASLDLVEVPPGKAREIYRALARSVRYPDQDIEERGLGPDAVTPALLDEAAIAYHGQPAGLDVEPIRQALDPGRFIAARTLRGGPAPAESLRQADLYASGLAADEAVASGIHARLDESARRLEAAIDAIIGT